MNSLKRNISFSRSKPLMMIISLLASNFPFFHLVWSSLKMQKLLINKFWLTDCETELGHFQIGLNNPNSNQGWLTSLLYLQHIIPETNKINEKTSSEIQKRLNTIFYTLI